MTSAVAAVMAMVPFAVMITTAIVAPSLVVWRPAQIAALAHDMSRTPVAGIVIGVVSARFIAVGIWVRLRMVAIDVTIARTINIVANDAGPIPTGRSAFTPSSLAVLGSCDHHRRSQHTKRQRKLHKTHNKLHRLSSTILAQNNWIS